MTDLMSVREAAEKLGVSRWTITRAIHAEELPAVRVRNQFRIERSAVEAFARPVGAATR